MRFTIAASVAALLALASVTKAQDANCSAVIQDYAPGVSGTYQKCFTDEVYSAALVSQGGSPNYTELINQVCGQPACSSSTLLSATTKYINACNASMDAEASMGNILSIGKNALEVFFAEPIREAYCTVNPAAPPASKGPPVVPVTYCLAQSISDPTLRFVTNLGIYLTSGTIRASQEPFFIANNLVSTEVCSDCSQAAMNSTIEYLATTLMPRMTPFYTPEFVQYWTKLVPAYNTLCKTSFTQTWPTGTLNVTVTNVPTGSPTTALPTATATTATATATATNASSGAAGALKPVAGVATALLMAVAALL
ncbi:hypothetical protein BGZ58_010406 [Dissophora ornata]|nr:hypothetical protein BGZ58_010406 [Dissophora ornata]